MEILLLNFTDFGGGAATASLQLVIALNEAGIKATLGVVEKKTDSPYVIELRKKRNLFEKISKKFLSKYEYLLRKHFRTTNSIFHSLNFYSLLDIDQINIFNCDIIHLHWIGDNTLSLKDVSRINKPIIWTLHDSWACCGAEHYQNILENDIRFSFDYTRKNKPKSTKGFDICKIVYKRKKHFLLDKAIHFISPSYWEKEVLRKSSLFSSHICTLIPNIIDTRIFKPVQISGAVNIKEQFNLSTSKKIIGFGAAYDIDQLNSVKGGQYLIRALQDLENKEEYQLLVFGPASASFASTVNVSIFFAGYISNAAILSTLYKCCDTFVCPSIIENLPYTVLESISCGIPVVAFNAGGIPDIIEHNYNGYLAEPYESGDLAKGIKYVIANKERLSKNCLLKGERDFNKSIIVEKHIETYKHIIEANLSNKAHMPSNHCG